MTIEETKQFYEKLLDALPENDYKEAARISIKVLDKQIPKEHHHTRVVEVKCKVRESVCPACLYVIITKENEYPKHCTWCGQALDWSDCKKEDKSDV